MPQTSDTAPKKGNGPCSGITVVDFSRLVAGPYATMILADLGAEVIKVEDPGGDVMRMGQPNRKGVAANFEINNRGKKSIQIDLKSDEGKAYARKLIDQADMIVENFRPDVMKRLGFDYEELRKTNPGLIYVKITGFGSSGPYVARPAFDQVVQGISGYMPKQGAGEAPEPIRNSLADRVTGIWAAHAAVAALLYRDRNGGEGQMVETNLLNAWSSFVLADMMVPNTLLGIDGPQPDLQDTHRMFETSDGHVIGLILMDNQFKGICEAFDRQDLLDDPRFSNPRERVENITELFAEFAPEVKKLTKKEFLHKMVDHDVPFGPVNGIHDFFEDPQAVHNRCYVDFDDEELGKLRHLNHPIAYEKATIDVARRAPLLGEHNDSIRERVDGS